MSSEEVQQRFKLKSSEYYVPLSEELVEYVDETAGEDVGVKVNLPSGISMHGHGLTARVVLRDP